MSAYPLGGLRRRDDIEGRPDQVSHALAAIRYALLAGDFARGAQMAEARRAPDRVVSVLKAAVAGGGVATWASPLVGTDALGGFASFMRGASVFDTLLGEAGLRPPLRSRVAVLSGSIATGEVAEHAGKPVRKPTLTDVSLTPTKVASAIAVTKQLLEGAPGAEEALGRELRASVGAAADVAFLADITAAPTEVASGVDDSLASVVGDITELLRSVNYGEGSRLWLLVDPRVAIHLSELAFIAGHSTMTPTGGTFLGLRVLVTDNLPSQTITLVDASGLAMQATDLQLRTSRYGTLQMDDAPTQHSGTPTATSVVSLFQSDSIGMVCEREVASAAIRPNAYMSLSGVTWGYASDSPGVF